MSVITQHITPETQPYWEGLQRDELLLQKCSSCGHIRNPVSWICPECLSEDFSWATMSGRGTVETFIWYMQRIDAVVGGDLVFTPDLPYNVAMIRLPEGPILVSNVSGIKFGELAVGDQVTASFDPVPDTEWSVLRFIKQAG
jgi:hypothetical protein